MKIYLTIILFFLLFLSGPVFSQVGPISENKTELPKVNAESLKNVAEIELYPNPTTDFLNVKLKDSNMKNIQFEMYNVIGNKLDLEVETVNTENYKINVKDFNSGYYLLIVKDQNSRYNKAFKFRKF